MKNNQVKINNKKINKNSKDKNYYSYLNSFF